MSSYLERISLGNKLFIICLFSWGTKAGIPKQVKYVGLTVPVRVANQDAPLHLASSSPLLTYPQNPKMCNLEKT